MLIYGSGQPYSHSLVFSYPLSYKWCSRPSHACALPWRSGQGPEQCCWPEAESRWGWPVTGEADNCVAAAGVNVVHYHDCLYTESQQGRAIAGEADGCAAAAGIYVTHNCIMSSITIIVCALRVSKAGPSQVRQTAVPLQLVLMSFILTKCLCTESQQSRPVAVEADSCRCSWCIYKFTFVDTLLQKYMQNVVYVITAFVTQRGRSVSERKE